MGHGPDFSVDPPNVCGEDVDLEKGMSKAEAEASQDWLARATSRKGYNIWVDREYAIYINTNNAKHELEISEIMGFNTGVYINVAKEALESSPDAIIWRLTSDTQYVVHVKPDKSKELITVAGLIYRAFKDHGIPQIEVECHTVEAKTILEEGVQKTMPFRYKLELSGDTHGYVPESLKADADMTSLSVAEVGSTFKGKFDKLPTWPALLAWEVEIDKTPPATVRPLKPKLWFAAASQLKADEQLVKLQ
ncbi:unnamed protein product [Prorocentrum cordatum]|uniref:Uncharacterized protein n=1 Tax=Prorocentrum cordatum TaxID=2364126 RepID=A0ABN9Q2K7_9DINO|nr:unnamed protein product [Polarella glacialis]